MRSFRILREEHYLFERTMKVLNRFLLQHNFSVRFFSDFFSLFTKLLLAHLKKEQILFPLIALPSESENKPLSFLDTSFWDRNLKEEIEGANSALDQKEWDNFSTHLEGIILLLSRHIFQQEEGAFSEEGSLSEDLDRRVARMFDDCYPQPGGKQLLSSFHFLLEEMERVVR
jgi:hypothetical protein